METESQWWVPGTAEGGGVLFNGCRVSVLLDEKVLELAA